MKKKTLYKNKAKIIDHIKQNCVFQETSPKMEMEMDLKTERWAENIEGKSSDKDEILEKIDHTQNY